MSFSNFKNNGKTGASAAGGSLFGNTAASAGAGSVFETNGGIFGSGTSTPNPNPLQSRISPQPPAGGILGNSNHQPNSNPNQGQNSTPAGNTGLFGSQSTPSGTPSLFGGGNPAAQSSNTPLGGLNPSSSPFGGPKPTEQADVGGTKPVTSDFFSKPPTSSSAKDSGSNVPAPLGGGLFGSAPKPAENPPSSSGTPAPTGSIFSGSLFSKKPEESTSTTGAASGPSLFGSKDADATKSGTKATSTGGLFGNLGSKKDDSNENKPSTTTAPSIFGGSIFGSKDDKGEKKEAPAQASLSLSLVAGEKGKDTSGPNVTVAVSPPSMLKGKTIEEIVNRWSSELDSHVREFNKFAAEVAVWDRALMENGNNLAALYSHVSAAEREQNDIDQALDHIEQQQRDLAATLDVYEKSEEEILGSQGGSLRSLDTGPADAERDKNYMLATGLHTHLDDLSSSLTQMIDSVNAVSISDASGSVDGSVKGELGVDDPVTQIAQILSSHLESLQWIDGAVRDVEGKVAEVEKRVKESGIGSGGPGGNGHKVRGFGI